MLSTLTTTTITIPTIVKTVETIIYSSGYNSGIILGIIGIYLLRNMPPYLWTFIIGNGLNLFLVKCLKVFIRQARPPNPIPFPEMETPTTYTKEEQFGMPSGHAQIAFFMITYIYLVKKSPSWLVFSLFLGCITLYQRWVYRRHTVEQLVVGCVAGSAFAYILFTGTRKYLSDKKFY